MEMRTPTDFTWLNHIKVLSNQKPDVALQCVSINDQMIQSNVVYLQPTNLKAYHVSSNQNEAFGTFFVSQNDKKFHEIS